MPLLVGLEGALLAALLLAAGLVYYTLYDPVKRRALAIAKTYPQPKALPIIGHVLHVFKQRDELFLLGRSFRERHGSRYSINMFSRTFFNISDPEAVEVVLSSSKHSTKGYVYGFLEPWLGQGLLTSNGPLWHSRRKLLTPAFHFRILDQFSEHLEKQAVRLVDELDAAVRAAPDANSVDVVPFISSSTLRSICVTAMGNVKFRTDDTMSEKSYFDAIHSVGLLVVFRMIRPWLWPPLFFKLSSIYKKFVKDLATLHRCTEKMIAERKVALLDAGDAEPMVGDTEEGTRGARQRRPFLDVLLQAQRDGADLSDRDIREEVDTFMFEGHDTTSMALSWSLELLGRHADVQARLVEELDGVDSDWESISKLPYLDRVLKECLRLRPSVPFISRLLDSDAVTPDGQIFPAGGQVNVHIYDLHRHPDHFPDPERFDPDRFLPALEQARHPFAYLPFSAGPRNCIGKRFAVMELKILLASVVRRFNIQSAMKICGGREFIADIVLRPRSGVHLRLTPRQL